MKTIVITGSTRGIGYGLAEQFLARGCAVVISGRSQEAVDMAISQLSHTCNSEKIGGYPCDVRDRGQVEKLWDQAISRFGRIDIWINNAGIGTRPQQFWELPPETHQAVLEVNTLGLMHGCAVAIQGMLEQGSGFIYNMAGLGSDGRRVNRILLYGTTKYALTYLTDGLARELRDTPVKIGALSPGMVITDLLMGDYEQGSAEWEQAKKIFNILADRVETVTPWLVDKMLANRKNGVWIRWLTTPKIIWRFLTARLLKRDPFAVS